MLLSCLKAQTSIKKILMVRYCSPHHKILSSLYIGLVRINVDFVISF